MTGRIAIVGEAWSREEAAEGRSFVGSHGRVLNSLLSQVGIARDECLVTSVFKVLPQPRLDVINLCGPKTEGIPWMPYLARGKYVRAEYEEELLRLYKEIQDFDPNVIIAMGAAAAWAFLHTSGIKQFRGAPALGSASEERLGRAYKILPTYHPLAVVRDQKIRPVVLADLMKAKREAAFPEVLRPEREVWVDPTLEDIREFKRLYLDNASINSIDIETKRDTITCIGFAPRRDLALVVPFHDPRQKDGNYWRSQAEEVAAWNLVKEICEAPVPAVFQNGLYDIHFLWRTMGITVPKATHDTMLLHHALQPEMEKGLGFLATIYTDEASWKFMRKTDTIKKED